MSERTPLLHYLHTTDSDLELKHESQRNEVAEERKQTRTSINENKTVRKLGTLFGVVVPTLLSMFSVVVFLRIGFVVGQAGLYQSIAMFLVAYFIITMTVLSVCAISTNGALNAGGAYYMISRALGPEFGGSIGIMFFLANVCGSALYVLGLVEAILSTFGIPEDGISDVETPYQVLPSGYWWSLLYGTALLLLCFIVCLVGAHIYAKTTFIIFIIVISVLASIFISFFIVGPKYIILPDRSINGSSLIVNYTGFHLHTLKNNLMPKYTIDYTTGAMMSFTTVFAVMFNGCTGIMAGSNMSGDLKNPSHSIPRGTLAAVFITFTTYNVLGVLAACSCDRRLLQRDYSFLGYLNIWPPLVKIGVYSAAISAAMSNLIGASRVLYALSKDNLFGGVLALAKKTSQNGNPWASVLASWFLVQMVLFAGKLNTIAGVVTIFFLLVYAAVNLACLALEWASAPNFRPSFRCFTWHTSSLGILGCLVMMFLINAIYAFSSIAFMLVLFLLIHHFGPISEWGYISQALIFHQVRKYLLKLDVRKDHVKFWRPQILLMVANPHRSVGLITFINDLKKSGLYVLGHVMMGLLDGMPFDSMQIRYDSWLSLVDYLNIKAFVNLTLADSVRHGVQNLLFITGFGGMRPNTLVLGFHGDCTPQDQLQEQDQDTVVNEIIDEHQPVFPVVDAAQEFNGLNEVEYVSIISDAIKMGKNVALARYFSEFYRDEVLKPGRKIGIRNKMGPFIDVWPLNLLRPDSTGYVNVCSLFLLQLGCVLQETRAWSQARLRLFLCVEAGVSKRKEELKLQAILKELRIFAKVHMITWDEEVALHWKRHGKPALYGYCDCDKKVNEKQEVEAAEKEGVQQQIPSHFMELTDEFICTVNKLIHRHSDPQPAVRFLYLPHPPGDSNRYCAYLHQVNLLSRDLGPTLLVHGIMPVVTTDL